MSIFHLPTDPDFGSREFVNAVGQRTLTLESAAVFFAFLEKNRPDQVEEYELTVDDCVPLIRILNPSL